MVTSGLFPQLSRGEGRPYLEKRIGADRGVQHSAYRECLSPHHSMGKNEAGAEAVRKAEEAVPVATLRRVGLSV